MVYNSEFENFLQKIDEEQYIGLGNPNAKILFIGKEAGLGIGTNIYHGTVKSWKNKEFDYSKGYIPDSKHLRNFNHTWQRYQMLYDNILSNLNKEIAVKEDKYEINFVENIFTTELSNLHAPNTKEAKKQEKFKSELEKRKNEYFTSEFIHKFPVTVVFASDNNYIETYPGEVCKLFNVNFDGIYNNETTKYNTTKYKIWLHSGVYNEEYPRLLIHTRQLTRFKADELISDFSKIIVEFLKENSIEIDTKNTTQ